MRDDRCRISSGRLVRNTKSQSNFGVEAHLTVRRVESRDGGPRFEGYTADFSTVEHEVRAEDFDGDRTLGLRAPASGDFVYSSGRFYPFSNRFEPRDVAGFQFLDLCLQ